MKYIELKHGQQAIVDDEDFELLYKDKWRFNNRYIYNSRREPMHRLIINAPRGSEVDHINGNSLDNRKVNLRVCDRSQNLANRGKFKNNKSGYKGVCWNKNSKKWMAQIQFKKKLTRLGDFTDILEAAKAYDKKAKELHGEFANLNFKEI